jgi:hypothetical protein
MPGQKPIRIIIDTNIWISFLIGKELQDHKELIVEDKVRIITSDQLIEELILVTSREKLRKHFNHDRVSDFIALLNILAERIKIRKVHPLCRDPKDDFLLALSREGKANYLITGDKDLLDIGVYGRTKIVTVKKFKEKFR